MPSEPPIADTAPVRPGEEIDPLRLSAWLRTVLPGQDGPCLISQFPSGHSNLTYLVQTGGQEFVLRRPPVGPVAPKAHDMAREFAVLAALHRQFPLAPQPLWLCQDTAVLGCVFYLMERRRGLVIRGRVPEILQRLPNAPERISEAMVNCLAALHAVEIVGPLQEIGKPEGFLERQVRGWTERWLRAKTGEVPAMDAVAEWLRANLPPSGPATVIHNDFKLDNVMLDQAGRITAVLDWEMATLGDPLADLGLALTYWCPPDGGGPLREPAPPVTLGPGWFDRDRFVDQYARRCGRDVSAIAYHEVLGAFKLAVIVQQIYQRYHRGQTRDERFRHFHLRTLSLAEAAADRIAGGAR